MRNECYCMFYIILFKRTSTPGIFFSFFHFLHTTRISRDWAKYVELSVVRGNQIMTYSQHFEVK